ncbi:MAG: cytochrome c biogenesis protein [Gammaproteobacteria bacterium]|nr:cytochrome c biogenesis protein [Gammaproteobacteria bacterium]MDH5778105.1 cytochrome c biogenesis protein [Gammaproteobacteria bacterium]
MLAQLQKINQFVAPYFSVFGFSVDRVLWTAAVLMTMVFITVWRFQYLAVSDVVFIVIVASALIWYGLANKALRLFVWLLLGIGALFLFADKLSVLPSSGRLTQMWMWLVIFTCIFLLGRKNSDDEYKWSAVLLWICMLGAVLVFLLRWYESWMTGAVTGQIPLSHSGDVLLLLVTVMTALVLFFQRKQAGTKLELGAVIALGVVAVVVLSYPPKSIYHLNQPILQLFWLKLHVPAMVLAYAALLLAGFSSLSLLIRNALIQPGIFYTEDGQLYTATMYKLLKIGILALSVGVLTGLFWSDQVWGHYLIWEPKQIMAVSLWLYYLAALHLRLDRRRQTIYLAWWLSIGLSLLVFTSVGIDSWFSGRHSFIVS